MNKKLFSTGILVLALALSLALGVTLAQEGTQEAAAPANMVDSAFTYQGSLTDGSNPANGAYDFEFKLYDAASGGSQVGSTVASNDVNVSDGLFTVELGFGSNVFTGDARWLEIGVRGGSETGAYTTLTPRQPLTAAPYALSLRPGVQVIGDLGALTALSAKNTNSAAGFGLSGETDAATSGAGVRGYATSSSGNVHGVWGESNSSSGYGVYGKAPQFGVYGEASRTSNYAYGVYGKAQTRLGAGVRGINMATSGNAFGVYGSTDSADGYAGYFDNEADGVDIMAAGSGIIKSEADSVLYLSPHDMVVRGSSGVSVTPLDSGGADIYYTSSGWKYISIPAPTFGSLFGSSLYIESIEVCYKTDATGYIGTTAVLKNNGSTGATSYINDGTDRTSATHTCYTVTDLSPAIINNSTWVQFNIWSNGSGHTYVYTVKLTLTETP
jgi:hypothetical protein